MTTVFTSFLRCSHHFSGVHIVSNVKKFCNVGARPVYALSFSQIQQEHPDAAASWGAAHALQDSAPAFDHMV
jgi:hypothetical protein